MTTSKSVTTQQAVDWMVQYLKNGPKLAIEGRDAAYDQGIKCGMLLRVRRFLGIKKEKGYVRRIHWQLPPGPIPKYEKKKKGAPVVKTRPR